MYQIYVVVFSVLSTVFAGSAKDEWIKSSSTRISFHIDDLKRENASLLEKHALRVDYGGMGVSVGKALNKDAVELGLYVTDKVEGRRKKVGDVLIPALIGLKIAGIAALFSSFVTVLLLKFVAITKLSAVVAAGIFISKLFVHSTTKSENRVEIVPYPYNYYPTFFGYSSATGYNLNGGRDSSNIQRAEGQYGDVETASEHSNETASKRLDWIRQKHQLEPVIKSHWHIQH